MSLKNGNRRYLVPKVPQPERAIAWRCHHESLDRMRWRMRQFSVVAGQRNEWLSRLDVPQNRRSIPAGRDYLIATWQPISARLIKKQKSIFINFSKVIFFTSISTHHHRGVSLIPRELCNGRPQHVHLLLQHVVVVLLQFLLGRVTFATRWCIPVYGRLPNVRSHVPTARQNNIATGMELYWIHGSAMACVLQQTLARVDAPNTSRTVCGGCSNDRLTSLGRHLPNAVLKWMSYFVFFIVGRAFTVIMRKNKKRSLSPCGH